MYNGFAFIWIKVINDSQVDTFELMSAMGSSSKNLILYTTRSSSPYIPLIFRINKSDGSIIDSVEINDTISIGEVNPPSR